MKIILVFFSFACSFVFSSNYVTCDFIGQLGNQMFQIAATVAYALENHCEPIFPNLLYAEYGRENYQNVFYRLNLDTSKHVSFLLYDQEGPWPGHWIYTPIPCEPLSNLRLRGYFQTEKYFKKYENYIRELFAPKEVRVHGVGGLPDLIQEQAVPVPFQDENGTPLLDTRRHSWFAA